MVNVLGRKMCAALPALCFALMLPPCLEAQQVVDYLSAAGSAPLRGELLVEASVGSVRRIPAQVIELPESSRSLVAAAIPGPLGRRALGLAFIIDPLRESPGVMRWTPEAVLLNMLSVEALQRDILELERSIQEARIQSVDLQDRLREIEAVMVARFELDALREQLEEKRELEQAISEQQQEIARIEHLIEVGRQLETPEEINELRVELSEHLREAAQVTAAADRFTRRRLEVARNRVKAKLKLIEELKEEDPELLAREILELRKRRNELEVRLGRGTRREQNDQF